MSKKLLICIVIIIFIIFIFNILYRDKEYSANIPNKNISFIIADTPETHTQGLSNRESLPENTAMLFIFETPDKYGFWMKDMKFSIDIIWLDEKGKIIHIEKDVKPETYPDVFFPPENSLYVLETNAGFAEKNHLMVGNILDISKKSQK
ncbi:MAG: DUF192 domain-containing protein [Candidatus Taylorbacteria bacterium]|nr:DUF192 domain-containing protein [Candidatus Taylorbacteria bacterium]